MFPSLNRTLHFWSCESIFLLTQNQPNVTGGVGRGREQVVAKNVQMWAGLFGTAKAAHVRAAEESNSAQARADNFTTISEQYQLLAGALLLNLAHFRHQIDQNFDFAFLVFQMTQEMMTYISEDETSKDFVHHSLKFMKEFDLIAEDLFQGAKLENLANDFIKRHEAFIVRYPYPLSELRFNEATWMDFVKDDFRLLSMDCSAAQQLAKSKAQNQQQVAVHNTLAQVYWRAAMASYLRATYNKSRKHQEDNRQVAVDWARRAIRYDACNFDVAYWFMIAIGWQLDGMPTCKEKIVLSQIFKLSTLRCIELKHDNPLAHHLLGRYYYSVGNLSWFERTIIKTLLLHDAKKQFKIEGSHAEAEQKFRYAHSLKDDWPPTGLWMARTLLAQKRPLDEVRQWIEMGLAYECKEPTTEIEREELLELKAKLKL